MHSVIIHARKSTTDCTSAWGPGASRRQKLLILLIAKGSNVRTYSQSQLQRGLPIFGRDDIETYKWLKLAMIHMPEGIPRDTDRKILEKLKRRITPAQISEGDRLAQEWRPLRKTTRVMGNKE